ncbi:putative calcium-binding protein CML28 [Morus notabilis]|uniref:Putative calcium-binding protein CML28 n=1 Tax=Morus notabilis TaxID=981085 RepID=W9RIA8_9ROSA|nr:calmodulin-like protein 3 [Morus notabilis]EXB75278.1 putative calcium-binding protein CML28 [Morus notabilis]
MVLNLLLLAILFIAGLFNLFFYFPTKKFYAWLQSFFSSSTTTTTSTSTITTKSSLPHKKERNISSKKLAELRKVFATFDKNNDGFITKQELKDSLKNIRIFMTDKEVEDMVMKSDSNGDGLIDFEEFGMLCESMIGDQERSVPMNGNKQELGFDHYDDDDDQDLKEAFDVFDKDKDGLISVEELGSILSSLGLNEGKKIENCKEMIRKVDMDGDGMVNFEEFKKMMKSGGNALLLSS